MRLLRHSAPLLLLAVACATPSGDTTMAPTTAGVAATTAGTSPQGDLAEVIRVFDGDSLIVALRDGSEAEVRLIGINAPENDECFGEESKRALQQSLADGDTTLLADADDQDQFGRVLRYLYVGGVNVNLKMIRSGDALALQTGHSMDDDFAESGDAAADAGLGMWAADACGGEVTLPSVSVVDFVFDPRGRDSDQLNEEWVVIANEEVHPVAMGAWVLRDESTKNRFRFPDDFVLEAGDEVTVRTGCGSATGLELFWCSPDPVWSNGGDTIILQRADGTVVARERFAGSF